MTKLQLSPLNAKRVAAGRRNRQKRGPLTPEGREKLRQAALKNRPWEKSTGPRTAEGKARSAANGQKGRQPGKKRRIRASLADVNALMEEMARLRKLVER